ncbi:hypothetical protein ABIE61_001154 [Marinobacterium sp. MBR-111]|jgi:hypothetical protein|uniref:hypothetical protein n=1 Tax=Marinobacterium sp. MBR-111 TaxID=3156463 RepID=UPI0033925AC3
MPLNRHTLNSRTLGGPALDRGTPYPARKLLTLEQSVYAEHPARQLLTLRQIVAWRITAARRVMRLRQSVVSWDQYPVRKLLGLQQSVVRRVPSRSLLTLRQQVVDPTAPVSTHVPPARVTIGKLDVTGQTKLMTQIVITHGEDQPSTATFHLRFDIDVEINIPAFHGKTVEIDVYSDPRDANSPMIRLFTGWVNDARYDRRTRAVVFDCSDLRGERLGEESKQDLLQLTQAVYSEMTQREKAEGNEFVNEMMKTVAGTLGYTRDGALNFYEWGTSGEPIDWTLTNGQVHRDDITVDFQTRDEIKNTVTVEIAYRYYALRTVKTKVKGLKGLHDFFTDGKGSFLREAIIDRIQNGFRPWFATSYKVYGTPPPGGYGRTQQGIKEFYVTVQRLDKALGYEADLERYIAQPVSEHYTLKVTAPQSVRAYRKEVKGSQLSFSIESEFDTGKFEDREATYDESKMSRPTGWTQWPTGGTLASFEDAVAVATYNAATTDGGTVPVADEKRPLFNAGIGAAVKIAAKEIVQSHRKNYIDGLCRGRIIEAELGQIVHWDTRVVNAVGQISGITYTIGDAVRDTRIRTSISYMDDTGAAPVANWSLPAMPALAVPKDKTEIPSKQVRGNVFSEPGELSVSINYDPENGSLDVPAPEVPEEYVDEAKTEAEHTYEVPLENANITLINGW